MLFTLSNLLPRLDEGIVHLFWFCTIFLILTQYVQDHCLSQTILKIFTFKRPWNRDLFRKRLKTEHPLIPTMFKKWTIQLEQLSFLCGF
jgi:hypothetical protein